MKNKKSTEILLDPSVYWEKKLNINFETEYIRYKKLCTNLTKKEERKLDGIYYITYTEWEQKMIAAVAQLNQLELYEYIHFLLGRTKHKSFINLLDSNLLFPVIISLYCPFFFDTFNALFVSNKVRLFLFMFIEILIIFNVLRFLVTESKNDFFIHSFYTDLVHIAKKYKKSTKQCER